MLTLMIRRAAFVFVCLLGVAATASAQDQPPRLPFIVVDLHGAFMNFPSTAQLADSRGLVIGQLPGAALGADVGLHIYPLRWRGITFGIGAQAMAARARQAPEAATGQTPLNPVTERFITGAPQISFNFGSGNGWSYISGGIGRSVWQVVPDGADPSDADTERLQTSNYGGGGRWFIKKHLAFSFDVRVYGLKGGNPAFGVKGGSPRTNLLVIAAGASVK
jgi:hypothetical protein